MDLNKKISLVVYGAITEDFKIMAQLKKRMISIKSGQVKEHRVDCYSGGNYVPDYIVDKFDSIGIPSPKDVEIFNPSEKYPPHHDRGGISYFIPLESGTFYIGGVNYPVVPFVLYAFEDSRLHNTDFCAIMLK